MTSNEKSGFILRGQPTDTEVAAIIAAVLVVTNSAAPILDDSQWANRTELLRAVPDPLPSNWSFT